MTNEPALLTRVDILRRAAAGAVTVVPVGALEQHGPHLPVGTDAMLVGEVCRRAAAAARVDVLVAPVLWTGFGPHHVRFGATVTASSTTFSAMLGDVVASFQRWTEHVVIVNGHGGNRGPLTTFCLEHPDVTSVDYWELAHAEATAWFDVDHGSIGHAGQAETSMISAMGLGFEVPTDAAFAPIEAGDRLLSPDLGEHGTIGDPTAASPHAGRQFLELCGQRLAALLEQIAAIAQAGGEKER